MVDPPPAPAGGIRSRSGEEYLRSRAAALPCVKHDLGREFCKGTDIDVSHGPLRTRRVRDIPFCILYLLHWAGVIVLAYIAFSNGNPNRLFAGRDYAGNFCGLPSSAKSDSRLLYYTLDFDSFDSADLSGLQQVADTPGRWQFLDQLKHFSRYFRPVCVSACPCFTGDEVDRIGTRRPCRDSSVPAVMNRTAVVEQDRVTVELAALSEDICPYEPQYCVPVQSDTSEAVDRYCFPRLAKSNASSNATAASAAGAATVSEREGGLASSVSAALLKLTDYLPNDLVSSWNNVMADVTIAWPVPLICAAAALVSGMVFLVMLRYCAGLLVWMSIVIGVGLFVVAGAAAFVYAPIIEEGYYERSLTICSYVLWALGALFILIVLCLCERIQLGIAVIKSAALFVAHTPTVLFVPLVVGIITCVYYVFWIAVAAWTMSTLTEAESEQGKRFSWSSETQYSLIYHFFSLLWNNAFLMGYNQVVLAGVCATWYFTTPNQNGKRHPQGAVCRWLCWSIVYHMGSIAFGSLVLAVVQLVKWILAWLAAQTEWARDHPTEACKHLCCCGIGGLCSNVTAMNRAYIGVLSCLGYAVTCFEKFVKFLSEKAYIQVALVGKNFCQSSWSAFTLVLRNAGRIAALGGMVPAMRFLGLVLMTLTAGVVGFFSSVGIYDARLSSPIGPTVLGCFAGFVVGGEVLDVFAISVDTILQCFVADEEMTGKGQGGVFTPAPLREFFQQETEGVCCPCACGAKGSTQQQQH
mmetsp:Transcript_30222/g.87842  ORF Transcript_30222/g.87842 Transcript_30222/m.87842 type:complete len:750 (-) Transcript_30222:1176-3425(-)